MDMTSIPRTKEQLRRAVKESSDSHFFDSDTMRFFASRLCEVVGADSKGHVYFVTSEKFKGFRTPDGPRLYTVRKFDGKRVETVGEFQEYRYRSTAINAAKRTIKSN